MFPVILALLVATATDAPPVQMSAVFLDVTLIDATGRPAQRHQTVVIAGGKITSIEQYRESRVFKMAKVIDGRGKFLIPGLWDMHVHLNDERFLPLYIANGVTGVRDMWGIPKYQIWRQRIISGSLLGPRLLIGSPVIDGPKPVWPRSVAVKDASEARTAVTDSRKDGADFIKVYSLLPRDAYFAIAAESKKQDISFAGHVTNAVSVSEASDAGQKSIEHLTGILLETSSHEEEIRKRLVSVLSSEDPDTKTRVVLNQAAQELLDTFDPHKAEALYRKLAQNRTWQTPTLTVLRAMSHLDDPQFTNDARSKYMPASIKEFWKPQNDFRLKQLTPDDWTRARKTYELSLKIVGAMHRSGVPLLAGTDTPNPFCFPGFSIHDELALLVAAGLTPMDALQAATRDAASYAEVLDSYGTIEKGKTADLVLLNANPLRDIQSTTSIFGVMVGGRYFAKASLDKMLGTVAVFANRKSVVEPLLTTISEKGIDAGITQYRGWKKEQASSYNLDEDELNDLGYRLLRSKKVPEAIAWFQLVLKSFPDSSNAYDSLAEAYAAHGDKELSIANYKRSLELNPKNATGAARLRSLQEK